MSIRCLFKFSFFLLSFFFTACTNEQSQNTTSAQPIKKDSGLLPSIKIAEKISLPTSQEKKLPIPQKEDIHYTIITIPKPKGFGYDIFMGEKRFLHQPNIPAINGNKSFHTRKDAEKVAGLVIAKIQKNIMPPSISIQELDSLGIKIN